MLLCVKIRSESGAVHNPVRANCAGCVYVRSDAQVPPSSRASVPVLRHSFSDDSEAWCVRDISVSIPFLLDTPSVSVA